MFDDLLELLGKNLDYRDFTIFGQMTLQQDHPAFRLERESNSNGQETALARLTASHPDCW
jgi:hypothetical protein